MNKKIKVLCFTDNATGRDVEMLLPIRFFAERFLNCEFFHALNIDIHQIYKIKPDIILQANTIGSNLYFEISSIAHKQNIPLFALISEGNFRLDGTFDYWGFNRDRQFHQEYVCCWSERTAKFLREKEPHTSEKIVVTGGVGFDRYSIYKFMSKENLLKKYNKQNYKKFIGYAGWAFGKAEHPRGKEEILFWARGDEKMLVWIEEQRIAVRDILKDAVEKNPDTLFILKQHPQENAPERAVAVTNEMSELAHYDNVLYLCEQEAIHDLISVSDIWTCFESTTTLESWLMGKHTIYINPDPNFNRDPLYKGSPLIQTSEDFQKLIDEYFSTNRIECFYDSEKDAARQDLIKNVIGFGDGMNHIRAGYYFKKTIEKAQNSNLNSQYLFHFWHWLVYVLLRIAGPFYNRAIYSRLYKLKKHLWVFENYKMEKLYKLYKTYMPFYEEFYSKRNLDEKINDGSLFKELIG